MHKIPILSKHSSNPSLVKLVVDEKTTEDPMEITEQFNDYFATLGRSISNSNNNATNLNPNFYLKHTVI